MAKSHAAIAPPAIPTRVLFAWVGEMTYYAGPQPGDERPKGGGDYTKDNVGHEVFNFSQYGGRLYGYVAARINLKRIDPIAGGRQSANELATSYTHCRVLSG